ncbi:hypothetical protein Tco_0180290 [Tanacetum coccineum]
MEMRRTTTLEVLCTNTTNGYQSTMSNRHKDWLVQEQTALGAKGLTSPEQTAIGVNTPGSDENSLKLYDIGCNI